MHVSDDGSSKFCKFWNLVNFENMVKLHNISIAGTVRIFNENITFLNKIKFHMHVSDDDSSQFC